MKPLGAEGRSRLPPTLITGVRGRGLLRSSRYPGPLWLNRCRSRLLSGRTLLQDPSVAVRIAEKDEGVPAPAPSLDPRAICPVYNLVNLHAPLHQFGPGGLYVGDDEQQALEHSRRHVQDPGAQVDRAARAGRSQLDEAHPVADLGV